jgi:glutathione S-transferase
MLGEGPYLVGDRPTLADGLLAGVARWLEYHEAGDIGGWPKLQALRRRIEADPAVIYATAIENGETPRGSSACKGQVPLAEVIDRLGA